MDCVTLIFAASGTTRSWTPTGDVSLYAVAGIGTATAVISFDPAVATASFTAAVADSNDGNVICFCPASGNQIILPAPFPIEGGKTIFVAVSAKGAIALFYQPS